MAPPNPNPNPLTLVLLLLCLSASASASASEVNPFTSRAATIRYWNRKVPNNAPHPPFLLALLSPLPITTTTTTSSSLFSPSFCLSARLLCPNTSTTTLSHSSPNSRFDSYSSQNFTNYATSATHGTSSFSTYSPDDNIPVDTFRRYGRDATAHNSSFSSYSPDANVGTDNFTSYAASATAGSAGFTSYAHSDNVPNLKFTSYGDRSNGLHHTFTSYSAETNSGDQSFKSYAKNSNGVPTTFTSYARDSNVIGSGFSNYGEGGNGATDGFSNYGFNGNQPENNFNNYASGSNAASDTFNSYREGSNVGDDTFTSYDKDANAGSAGFQTYGKSYNPSSDTFKSYGEGDNPNHQITFKTYFQEDNVTFKGYAKSGVTFQDYNKSMWASNSTVAKINNKWVVEPGKFFRETELREGKVMPMPDVKDKMPVRSFLPRSIVARIPFEPETVKSLFGLEQDTALAKAVDDTIGDCRRAPSQGETKRCATSAEDMIDFAVEMLGNDIVVRSTESPNGSGGPIMIGKVKGINGGKVTRSVSCHQSLFPYMVYYCHSVPKVRVYEAEILAVETKEKINRGVAICHLDTSDWSPSHGAFVALGGKPGQIEVCHWIFNGDMTWAVADLS
ncbi:BURP domain-containing protein [Rhynchospora pubera]|uniref:BURP domain-containing protein n=1 Tax=Rhynchospora pubera TaxID=906938 RepID=A0AAV8CMC7_9POAL|nr:BURP domain-containing protein [Rhynchospora pubera]